MDNSSRKAQPIEETVSVVPAAQSEEKKNPKGFARLYPGVRSGKDTYTSPLLSVHTYNKMATAAQVNRPGIRVNTTSRQRSKGYEGGNVYPSTQTDFSPDERVQIIAVEDIISIFYNIDVKKNVKTERKTTFTPKPQGFWERCCCCWWWWHKPEQIPEHTVTENKAAERVIVISVEYVRHGHIDTSSHVRILDPKDKVKFFSDRMHTDTLQFDLYSSKEFESYNFDVRRQQAETLCRLVVQLKQMGSEKYPSDVELAQLISQNHTALFGDELHENSPILLGSAVQATIHHVQQPQITSDSENVFETIF